MAEFNDFKELEERESAKLLREGMRHEIKSENNVFFLDPPLEHAKFYWLQEFHRVIGIICSLPKLQVSREKSEES
jgi:dynein heavy chain 1